MEHLNNEIDTFKEQLSEADKTLVSNHELIKSSKYPFNKYANIFSVLLTKGKLSYDQYVTSRDAYFSRNPNLDKFEMAPRTFGQTWGGRLVEERKKRNTNRSAQKRWIH